MRVFILLLAVLAAAPLRGACPTGYGYRYPITIPHTGIDGTGTLSNFTIRFAGTYTALADSPTGRVVTGYDICFTNSGGTQLPHVLRSRNTSTGATEGRVKVDSINADTSDTVIYLYVGNAAQGSSEENATALYDSSHVVVLEMGDGTTLSTADSSANGFNFTNSGAVAAAGPATGLGSAQFVATDPDYMQKSSETAFDVSSWTVEAWVYFNGTSAYTSAIANRYPGNSSAGQWFAYKSVTIPDKMTFDIPWVAGSVVTGGTNLSNSTWYHLAWTKSGTTYTVYLNGASDGSAVNASSPTNSGPMTLGALLRSDAPSFSNYLYGRISNFRFSNAARSQPYLKATRDSFLDPSTFYSVGSEEPLTAPWIPRRAPILR